MTNYVREESEDARLAFFEIIIPVSYTFLRCIAIQQRERLL